MIFVILTILLPIIAALLLAHHDEDWSLHTTTGKQRVLIFTGTCLVAFGLINGLVYYCGTLHSQFYEVWNYRIQSIKHEEKWTTRESRQERYACGTDSKGNTKYCYRTVYYTQHHGPYWTAIDQFGNSHRIDQGVYGTWRNVWKNEQKTGEHKGSAAGLSRAITGSIFECQWTNEFNTLYPWSEIHSYVNKVRASNSIFNYQKVDEATEERYYRPADEGVTSPIISYDPIALTENAEMALRRLNATLGPTNQVHIMILLFDADKHSLSVVSDVLAAWKGPNKNELCIFLGMSGQEIRWCDVRSWMDDTTIHAAVRNDMIGMKTWDTGRAVEILRHNVNGYWKRKQFSDFDYLSISIHPGWVVTSVILMVLGMGVGYVLSDETNPVTKWLEQRRTSRRL